MQEEITSTECQIILTAIDGYQKNNSEAHEQLIKLVEASIKGVQLNFNSNAEVFTHRLDGINNHLAKLNGSVADLYRKQEINSRIAEEFKQHKKKHHNFNVWIKKRWPLLLLGLVGMLIVVEVLMAIIGLDTIIEVIK